MPSATERVLVTGGSIIVIIATDALAFATAEAVRRTPARRSAATTIEDLPKRKVSPLFQAVAEATEEAVYNAMLQATSTTGVDDHRLEALPLDRLKEILARHGIGTPTK
jgi:D-aminopeptidase